MSILKLIGLYEGEKEPELKIFCDMDGVLCNWQKAWLDLGVSDLDGEDYEKKYGATALWSNILKKGGLEFWSEMDWMPDGKQLWNYIKKYNPTILTTPAKNKFSKEGKEDWVKRELGPDVPLIFSKDKFEHADTESILIDDYEKKIDNWINQGDGIGILHTSADKTIEELKKYGL